MFNFVMHERWSPLIGGLQRGDSDFVHGMWCEAAVEYVLAITNKEPCHMRADKGARFNKGRPPRFVNKPVIQHSRDPAVGAMDSRLRNLHSLSRKCHELRT